MSTRTFLTALCLMSIAFLVFFQFSQRGLADPWEQLVLNPEFRDALLRLMEDERKLADMQPHAMETYKEHFLKAQSLLAHMEILEANRQKISQRYNLLLTLVFGLSLTLIVAVMFYRRYRLEARLELLRGYLSRLAIGETDVKVANIGSDVIGRIGAMIQTTSSVLTRASQRVKALENLEAWQESSRRMAHEIRTPLTTLRLEIDQLVKTSLKAAPQAASRITQHEQGIREELAHLTTFTDQYASFSKIGKPHPKEVDLTAFLHEFQEIYAHAWPNLEIRTVLPPQTCIVLLDKRLIRQVLVNLCNNSSKALGDDRGHISFSLRAELTRVILRGADNGPGIHASIRDRLFQPYATTREVGEGTGLGLAISRKILLDHGGELELEAGNATGAAFLLILPFPDTVEAS